MRNGCTSRHCAVYLHYSTYLLSYQVHIGNLTNFRGGTNIFGPFCRLYRIHIESSIHGHSKEDQYCIHFDFFWGRSVKGGGSVKGVGVQCIYMYMYRYRSAIALVFAKRDLITICDYYNTRYSVCHDFLIADLTTHTIVRFLTDLASRRARVALTSRPS